MAKFCGVIGFASDEETSPDVYDERISERIYYGDIVRSDAKWERSDHLNDNFNIQNNISILADSFALKHTHLMRYVSYLGTRWKISSINVQHPRIILSIGGVYNGESSPSSAFCSTPTDCASC